MLANGEGVERRPCRSRTYNLAVNNHNSMSIKEFLHYDIKLDIFVIKA